MSIWQASVAIAKEERNVNRKIALHYTEKNEEEKNNHTAVLPLPTMIFHSYIQSPRSFNSIQFNSVYHLTKRKESIADDDKKKEENKKQQRRKNDTRCVTCWFEENI